MRTSLTICLRIISLYTQDLGLDTVWDDVLCYLLSPALTSYELERVMGVNAGNEEFQDAVRGHVHEGHTFKGFPIQLTHTSAHRAFTTCLRWAMSINLVKKLTSHIDLCQTWTL